jgi:predicted nucleic acid-binding protein
VTLLVVDASVALKWLVEEEGSAEAEALLEQPLAAPDLLAAEVGNVLWKKARRGELSRDEAATAARRLVTSDVMLHPVLPLLAAAVEVGVDLGHPVYDCLYLALARELGTQVVTDDRRLLARLAASGRPDLAALARPLA